MAAPRGINVLDLIGSVPAGAQAMVPSKLADLLETLSVLDVQTIETETAFVYLGTLRGLDSVLPAIQGRAVNAPELLHGIDFQLARRRTPAVGDQNVEPAPDGFVLDLFLDRMSLPLPFTAARLVPADGERLAYLVPAGGPRSVRLVASGVYRIELRADGDVDHRLIDRPDPFDPDAPAGAIVECWFEPPHFLISTVGITARKVTIDFSETVTPDAIVARGQDAAWKGVAIEEATLYFPGDTPISTQLSIGIKDLLLGSPFGLQLEANVQLGFNQDAGEDPIAGSLRLFVEGQQQELAMTGEKRLFEVTLPADPSTRVRAHLDNPPSGVKARWILPDGARFTGLTTPYFVATPGDTLQLEAAVPAEDGGEVTLGTTTVLLSELRLAPRIDAIGAGGLRFLNTIHVSGSPEAINGLEFATENGETVEWIWDRAGDRVTRSDSSYRLALDLRGGLRQLTLGLHPLRIRHGKETRRVFIHVLDEGELVIGCEAGAFRGDGTRLEVISAQPAHSLKSWHRWLRRAPAEGQTELTPDGNASVSAGTVARVTVRPARPAPPPPAPEDPPVFRQPLLQELRMDFAEAEPVAWGRDPSGEAAVAHTPFASDTRDGMRDKLADWARAWHEHAPGVGFAIVGRTDDIGRADETPANERLSRQRAIAVETLFREALAQAGISPPVSRRGEQDITEPPELLVDRATYFATDIALVPADLAGRIPAQPALDWLIKRIYEGRLPAEVASKRNTPPRPAYRRATIYAIPPASPPPPPPPPPPPEAPADREREVYVPGPDSAPDAPAPPADPTYPYAVRVRAIWDSPHWTDAGDAWPTLLEASVTWVQRNLSLPQDPADPDTEQRLVEIQDGRGQRADVHTILARYTYDARTDETVITARFDSQGEPAGWRRSNDKLLSTALALGPALMPALDTAGIDDVGARLVALLAASAIAAEGVESAEVVLHSVEAEYRMLDRGSAASSRFRFTLDYSVALIVDVAGFRTDPEKPLQIRYRGVGALVDTALPFPDMLSLVYDDADIDVEDPGRWTMDGVLGQLLRVTGARVGTGSAWIELDLGFALDLGVVRVSDATVRVTFTDGDVDVSLRGLSVSVDVPKILSGTGRLVRDVDGTLRGALELAVIPAGTYSAGAMSFGPNGFFSLQLDTTFATPIPLLSSGLALFGFSGRFVSNGTRNLSGLPADMVERELGWYARPSEDKYVAHAGQWALGLGAVVGTQPDKGYSFHGRGMLAIEVPDPSVVFGVDGRFLSRPTRATERDETAGSGSAARLLGLIAIDSGGVALGIRGEYRWRKLLRVDVPISGFFPFTSGPAGYLRVGSDGFEGRAGQPVRVHILPDSLDAESSAYLMIEERGLPRLGGRDELSFPGFAVGFGAKFEIDWGNSVLGLYAAAEVLAGLGTNPLTVAAAVGIRGEVRFLLLSAGITGEIGFRYVEGKNQQEVLQIRGEVCGTVGVWRFKKRKCGEVLIGDTAALPEPPPPVTGMDLVTPQLRVIGAASESPGQGAVVWPDAIPLLHFAHHVTVGLDAGSHFTPRKESGPAWVGKGELRYAYRLRAVRIVPRSGDLLQPLASTWVFPAHRPAFPAAGEPAPDDGGRDLQLLAPRPFLWARNLIQGGQGLAGDPLESAARACQPAPPALPACAVGEDAVRLATFRLRLPPRGASPLPFSTQVSVRLTERLVAGVDMDLLADNLAMLGFDIEPGAVRPLPAPYAGQPAPAPAVSAVYEPAAVRDRGAFRGQLGVHGRFGTPLLSPSLVLSLCPRGDEISGPRMICRRYGELGLGQVYQNFEHERLRHQVLHVPTTGFLTVVDVAGRRALDFPDQGLDIFPPEPTSRVSVLLCTQPWGDDVPPAPTYRLKAFDAFGVLLHSVQVTSVTPGQDRVLTVQNSQSRITRVTLSGGMHLGALIEVCYATATSPDLGVFNSPPTLPVVKGVLANGTTQTWTGQLLAGAPAGCKYVRYVPTSANAWHAVTIDPWAGSHLGIMSVCGVGQDAAAAQQADQDARDELVDEWNEQANAAVRPLLAANSAYTVEVDWDVQTWGQRGDDGRRTGEDAPPADPWANPSGVTSATSYFHFRTAAAIAPGSAQPNAADESVFDPRNLTRYLLQVVPRDNGPPHFTEDPLRVRFNVPHVAQLLQRYGRELIVRIRRTDPPPGQIPPVQDTSDGLPAAWNPLHPLVVALVDMRMWNELPARAPCLDPLVPERGSFDIDADLEPGAEYEMRVVTPLASSRQAPDAPEIARVQFRTSRFAGPDALLAGLGLTQPDAFPVLPVEIAVVAALPTDAWYGNDQALDQTMAALGLDPWPLPRGPQLALLTLPGPSMAIAGVLIEADEPIERPGRLSLGEAFLVQPTSAGPVETELALVRSNAAGTRLLLAPASPVAMPSGPMLLRVQLRAGGGVLHSGRRYLTMGSSALAEEVTP